MYPEYLLLDSATEKVDSITTTASGVSSVRTILNNLKFKCRIENEFRRKLSASAKEYIKTVKSGDEAASSTFGLDAGDSASTTSAASGSLIQAKLADWLFDEEIVQDIIKKSFDSI